MRYLTPLFIVQILVLLSIGPADLMSQDLPAPGIDEVPSVVTPYPLHSGEHEGRTGDAGMTSAFEATLRVDDAPWLMVHFADYNLGERSRLTVRSMASGEEQVFSGAVLDRWGGGSGIFAGPAVEVSLDVAAGESGIYFEVLEVVSGVGQGEFEAEAGDCPGLVDNRAPSTAPASGRILMTKDGACCNVCTGWITANGSLLTAAHCADQAAGLNMYRIQFNPPGQPAVITSSLGVPARNQFTISNGATRCENDVSSGANVVCQFKAAAGQEFVTDWAIFQAGTNSHGETPIQVQNAFYRLSLEAESLRGQDAATIGYGIDTTVPARHITEQKGTGTYTGLFTSGSYQNLRYEICSPGGTSGAPVIVNPAGSEFTLGVHDGSGNDGVTSHVQGTSFTQGDLQAQVEAYPGRAYAPVIPSTRIFNVDIGSVDAAAPTGSVFRPFKNLKDGLDASSGAGNTSLLSIVTGIYPEAGANITVTPNHTINVVMPVGGVTVY